MGFLLPFVIYMVMDFGYSPQNAGYIAGWVASSYFITQCFSNIILGSLSDIIGRRIVLLIGIGGNAITSLLFGFSKSLWFAILVRSLSGLMNGNISVLKSYVREITNESNQARVYSYRSIGYAVGTIIGPLSGGALARPVIQYPHLFARKTILDKLPYLLPCMITSLISMIALILSFVYLEETKKFENQDDNFVEMNIIKDETNEAQDKDRDIELEDISLIDETENVQLQIASTNKSLVAAIVKHLKDFKVALKSKDVALSILLYSMLSFNWLCFDEVFAFWSIRDISEGGINFKTLDIGIAQSISGIGMILIQSFVYVPVDKKIGSLHTFQLSVFFLYPVFLFCPYTNMIASNRTALWICIVIIMICKSGFGTSGMASINLLINNSAHSSVVGSVNGMSASTAAVSRILAPIIGGSLFAWSSSNGKSFPLNFHLVYFLMVFINLLTLFLTLFFSNNVNKRKN